MEPVDIYQRAVDTFGEEAQIGQLHEEMGELMQAINKRSRSNEGTSTMSAHQYNVVEELVDLTIMCEQMRCIFDFNTQFDDMMGYKLSRLEETIDEMELSNE